MHLEDGTVAYITATAHEQLFGQNATFDGPPLSMVHDGAQNGVSGL